MATHNATEVVVGGAVLAAAIAFVAYATQSTGFARSPEGYELSASFRSLEGVNIGTDVRLAGVKVGSVLDMSLDPKSFRAETTFAIEETVELPEDTAAVISSEGLLGGSFVELLPGGSEFSLEPGSEIEDTQGSVSIVQLLLKFVSGDGN